MRGFLFIFLSIVAARPCLGQVTKAWIKEGECFEIGFETPKLPNPHNLISLWQYDSFRNEKLLVVEKRETEISQTCPYYILSDCSPQNQRMLTYILYSISSDTVNQVGFPDTLSIDTLRLNLNHCNLPRNFITDEHAFFHPAVPCDHGLEIYNRYGQLVFETSDPTKGWDGGECPPGTYYWIVRFADKSHKSKTGTVTVLRDH
jgi:hypothetical protein